jgi:hypothetical protein
MGGTCSRLDSNVRLLRRVKLWTCSPERQDDLQSDNSFAANVTVQFAYQPRVISASFLFGLVFDPEDGRKLSLACRLLHAGFLVGVLFNTEDRDNIVTCTL